MGKKYLKPNGILIRNFLIWEFHREFEKYLLNLFNNLLISNLHSVNEFLQNISPTIIYTNLELLTAWFEPVK